VAHAEASKKRKADAYSKMANKHVKALVMKKTRALKIVVPKAKSGVK
jgi:hypothetical protein